MGRSSEATLLPFFAHLSSAQKFVQFKLSCQGNYECTLGPDSTLDLSV